jgi:GPH family glycoside/pentoside/hexuronide:cation symporter
MALAALTTFFSVREQAHSREELPREGFFSTYLGVFKNIPYLIVLITFALHLMALNFLQGILVYYTKYVYKNEGLTTPSMILLLVVAMACIPVSVWVSKKIGKKRTYQIAFAVLAVACGLIFSFGHLWGPSFFLGMMVFAGVGIGFGYVAPWAMVPDTIEYDAHRTGERKEGAFYGMWTFTSKVGQSLSILISGLILSAGGYVAEAAQSSRAIFAIRLIIGPLPLLVFVGALVLIQFYPLDEKTYRALMAQAPADQATQQRPVQ